MTQAGDWTPERVTITLSSGTVYEYWPDVTDGYPWLCNADKESGSQSWGTIASVCRAIRTMEDFQKVAAAASQGTATDEVMPVPPPGYDKAVRESFVDERGVVHTRWSFDGIGPTSDQRAASQGTTRPTREEIASAICDASHTIPILDGVMPCRTCKQKADAVLALLSGTLP